MVTFEEQMVQPAKDEADLTVVNTKEKDASPMVAACLCPFAKQRCEVAVIECDENAIITCRESKYICIIEADQLRLFREGANVVTRVTQAVTDLSGRDMLVKQEPHRGLSTRDFLDVSIPNERVEVSSLVDRNSILRYRVINLFRILFPVRQSESDLGLLQISLSHHSLNRAEALIGFDDMPDVDSYTHEPGSTIGVGSTKADSGEASHLGSFLGEHLDDRAL
jgi:hypothetical protein